jgi:hypothetical protein
MFLRTMLPIIHKLNTGCFAFLGFLSESEMLHLGGTPYMLHRIIACLSFCKVVTRISQEASFVRYNQFEIDEILH